MSSLLRRCLFLLAVFLCWGIIITWSNPPSDFTQDYSAAIALLRGESIYGPAVTEIARQAIASPDSENFHPPLLSILFVPFTFLEHRAAFLLWGGICIAMFLIALEMLFRHFLLPEKLRNPVRAVALLWYPCLVSLGTGQVSILIAFLVILSWLLLESRRSLLSGAILGFAVMVKMYPGLLLLAFLCRRDWRAVSGFACSVLCCLLLALLCLGYSDTSLYFLHVMGRDAREWGDFLSNLSITGFISPLFSKARWVEPLYESPRFAGILLVLASALVLLLSISRLSKQARLAGQDFALLSCGMLLLSPIAWSHGFVALVLPVFWIMNRARELRSLRLAVWAVAACALISIPDIPLNRAAIAWFKPDDIPWQFFLLLKAPFYGLLLLWGLILAQGTKLTGESSIRP